LPNHSGAPLAAGALDARARCSMRRRRGRARDSRPPPANSSRRPRPRVARTVLCAPCSSGRARQRRGELARVATIAAREREQLRSGWRGSAWRAGSSPGPTRCWRRFGVAAWRCRWGAVPRRREDGHGTLPSRPGRTGDAWKRPRRTIIDRAARPHRARLVLSWVRRCASAQGDSLGLARRCSAPRQLPGARRSTCAARGKAAAGRHGQAAQRTSSPNIVRAGEPRGRRRRPRSAWAAIVVAPKPPRRRGDAPRAFDLRLRRARWSRSAPAARQGKGAGAAVMETARLLWGEWRMAAGAWLGSCPSATGHTVRRSVLSHSLATRRRHPRRTASPIGIIQAGMKAEWLLNYRGGRVLLPDGDDRPRLGARGVDVEPVDRPESLAIRGESPRQGRRVVARESAQDRVHVRQRAALGRRGDDGPAYPAFLEKCGIPTWWWRLKLYDCCTLTMRNFTGSTRSSSGVSVRVVARRNGAHTAPRRGSSAHHGARLEKAVSAASALRGEGGFLFAMCTATETLDLAPRRAGGTSRRATRRRPRIPPPTRKLDWTQALAFQGAHIEQNPQLASSRTSDGHR